MDTTATQGRRLSESEVQPNTQVTDGMINALIEETSEPERRRAARRAYATGDFDEMKEDIFEAIPP